METFKSYFITSLTVTQLHRSCLKHIGILKHTWTMLALVLCSLQPAANAGTPEYLGSQGTPEEPFSIGTFEYILPNDLTPKDIIGFSYLSKGKPVVWFNDGTRCIGPMEAPCSGDRHLYTLADGFSPKDVVAVAARVDRRGNDQIFIWYDNGTGSYGRNDRQNRSFAYDVPRELTAKNIVAAAFTNNSGDRTIVLWYDNGTGSYGFPDTPSSQGIFSYTLAKSLTPDRLLGATQHQSSTYFLYRTEPLFNDPVPIIAPTAGDTVLQQDLPETLPLYSPPTQETQ